MRYLLLATTIVAATGAFAPSAAQSTSTAASNNASSSNDKIQDVQVTAERRRSSVQKTAASVTVLNGAQLAAEGRYTSAQILEDVPGVTGGANNGDDPGAGITIRGMSANTEPAGTSSVPATATYVDGVYGGIGDNYDISRVEVLRGPQGTLYGRSATGGVVSTYTADPILNQYHAAIGLEFGSYALRHENLAVNLPIGDKLALRVAGNQFDQHGFVNARGGSNSETDARAKLLYQPTAEISALLGWAIEEQHSHSGGATQLTGTTSDLDGESGSPTKVVTQSAAIYPSENHKRQFWGNFSWTTPVGTVTYIPAFHTYYTNGQQLIGSVIHQDNLEGFDQIHTEELRISSLPESPVSWVAGAMYYSNALTNSTITHWIYSGALTFDQELHKRTQDDGAFADVIVPLPDDWKLTGGVRFDHTYITTDESYTANDATAVGNPYSSTWFLPEVLDTSTLSGSAGQRTYDNFTFRARVEKQITPQNLAYAIVSTGFLPGDVALSKTAAGPVAIPYDQEKLTAYEIGSKNRFFNNLLQFNADAYYYNYTGFQQTVNTSGNPQNPSFATLSSPARMIGGEAELMIRPTAADRITIAYGYINAYFVNQSAQFLEYQEQTRIPGIAPNTLSTTVEHSIELPNGSNILLRDQVRFKNGYDMAGVTESEAYARPYVHVGDTVIDDFSATWNAANGKYSVTGYINNIANSQYLASSSLETASGSDIEASVSTVTPRIFGVTLHASY